MAEKILIGSGKGGVGKSSFAFFLGRAFAKRGFKVLLIDTDTGLGALDILSGVSDKVVNTWADFESFDDLQAVTLKISEQLYLVPSPRAMPEYVNENIFADIIKACEADYDIILLDASAGIENNLKMASIAAKRAVFVATADEISVRCAASAANEAEKFGIERENMRIIINRFIKKAALKSKLLNIDGVIDKSGIALLGILPEDKNLPFISVTGKISSAESKFSMAVDRIADRLTGNYVPLKLKQL